MTSEYERHNVTLAVRRVVRWVRENGNAADTIALVAFFVLLGIFGWYINA